MEKCQWCQGRLARIANLTNGNSSELLACPHCDSGHPSKGCPICPGLVDSSRVFIQRGGIIR